MGPHFFKVLIGDFSHCLRIPPDFVKYKIAKDTIKTATLECPNGRIWDVELRKRTGGLYLQNGWQDFVREHSFQGSEVLVFRYAGDAHFTVQIFDQTACECKDVCTRKTLLESTSKLRKKQVKVKEYSLGSSKFSHDKAHKNEMVNSSVDCAADVIEGLYIYPNCGPSVMIRKEAVKKLISGIVSHDLEDDFLSRWQPTAEQKSGAYEKAKSFTSKFPFFVSEIIKCNSSLHIPSWFSRKYLPGRGTKMLFRDPRGEQWEVKLVYDRWARGHLSGGWRALIRSNNLASGDFCVFELVSKKEMHVHIFRPVEEVTPLLVSD